MATWQQITVEAAFPTWRLDLLDAIPLCGLRLGWQANDPKPRAIAPGGMVRIDNKDTDIKAVADLPNTPFALTGLVLGTRKLSDADLAGFRIARA